MITSRILLRKAARKLEKRPPKAPQTLLEIVLTLADAISFGYAETLGTWHLLDLPRAIFYNIVDKSKKTIPMECVERSDCVQVKDPELLDELYEIRKCLTRTMLFSKTRFRSFLLAAGIPDEDVLLRKRRAGLLKPAFTVIRDKESKCLLVFIRGTQSIKDTLTDVIGEPVSFNHFICTDDGELKRNNKISGHGHHGMVAAADWIQMHCTSILLKELRQHPDFKIKVVGHSLGGGTAVLLTFKLREIKQFSSCTCVTFGPAASVSLELAEFGKPFITSIINDLDIVPTLSAYSVHRFIKQGSDKHKRFQNAVVSHIPFASTAKAIADRAVTRGAQVVKKHKARTHLLLSWSHQRENVGALSSSKSDNLAEASQSTETSYEVSEDIIISESTSDENEPIFSSDDESQQDDIDEEEQIILAFQNITASTAASDEELLNQLEMLELEKHNDIPNITTSKDVTEEEKTVVLVHNEESAGAVTASYNLQKHPLYPPGRIMHIVPAPSNSSENSHSDDYDPDEKYLYLYETPKQLYEKLRFSRRMILDHMSSKYLKMIQKIINQLENESYS